MLHSSHINHIAEKSLTIQRGICYTLTDTKQPNKSKASKGRVTVAVASREWAAGGKPTRQCAVNKNLELREEIATSESRPLPDAPVIGREYETYSARLVSQGINE